MGSGGTALSTLIELYIATLDLLEAEGRLLRRETARLCWGIGLMAVALLLAAAGVGLCLASVYLFLSPRIGVASGIVTALPAFVAALVTAWGARRLAR